ncbi:MAG: alpha/beta fold hydrolase [Gemmatimonadetes bacterium]|nr:alpha/beta fold hydrolase [Gemmatimonadota bacterium]
MSESHNPPPVRGEFPLQVAMPWRLDGPDDPALPLVVCLHGMGMDEDQFSLLLQGLTKTPARLLVPRAPYPVEVRREGRIGASWYAYDGDQERFRRELDRTQGLVTDLVTTVEAEQRLKPRARFLLGFSQGGYCGAYLAMRNQDLFRGMIISGARVKTEFLLDEMKQAAGTGFSALLMHGDRDRSVSGERQETARQRMAEAGMDVELRTFDAGHSLGRAQVAVAREWVASRTGGGAA